MDDLFKTYKKHLAQEGLFNTHEIPVSGFFTGLRLEVEQERGRGWAEILRLDSGLGVGLCAYSLKDILEGTCSPLQNSFQFSLLLSGSFHCQIDSQQPQTVMPGDVWLCCGKHENISFTQQKNTELCGLSLVLPADLAEQWLGSTCCPVSHNLEMLVEDSSAARKKTKNLFPLTQAPEKSTRIFRAAHKLFHTERVSICGKLDFESLSLKLLSLILSRSENPASFCKAKKINGAVDEAVDILRQEWGTPPTISSLARRVGLNECYLKSGFRKRTGLSIGGYVRQQRMAKALELIESGEFTILETALSVGYSNPSHFTAAFKKFYGHVPSYYNIRS